MKLVQVLRVAVLSMTALTLAFGQVTTKTPSSGGALPPSTQAETPGAVQTSTTAVQASATAETSSASASTAGSTMVDSAGSEKPLFGRWLDLQELSHSQRYRNAFRTGGFHYFNNDQQRNLVSGRFKLDADGHYFVGFRASSGHYFNWAYSDYFGGSYSVKRLNAYAVRHTFTAAQWAERVRARAADPVGFLAVYGTPSNGWEFYLRELYFSATPVKAVTMEFGSFGIERGMATEMTTFDYDGYLTGERVRIHDSEHLFFDQIGFTTAFFGDTNTPSIFSRGSTFSRSNYRQVFLDKTLNPRVGFSGSYTWQIGTNALREAVVVSTPEIKVFDKVRGEAYQRLNTVSLQGLLVGNSAGFALTGERKFGPRVSGDIGYADIDGGYTAFSGSRFMHSIGFASNGDTIGQGKRGFVHASIKINSVLTASGYYTHAVGPMVNNVNQQGITGGLIVDFKALVNTQKRIF